MCNLIAMMGNRVLSDVNRSFRIVNAYKYSGLERGLDRGRDEVSGDGNSPCAVAPAV